MAVAALVLSDRLDKTSLVLAGQTETEVWERSHLFHSCRSNMLVILVLHLSKWFDKEPCIKGAILAYSNFRLFLPGPRPWHWCYWSSRSCQRVTFSLGSALSLLREYFTCPLLATASYWPMPLGTAATAGQDTG